jgi:hypothetical protein
MQIPEKKRTDEQRAADRRRLQQALADVRGCTCQNNGDYCDACYVVEALEVA